MGKLFKALDEVLGTPRSLRFGDRQLAHCWGILAALDGEVAEQWKVLLITKDMSQLSVKLKRSRDIRLFLLHRNNS